MGIKSNSQAVLRTVRRRKRGWFGGRFFVSFQVVDMFFCCGFWRQGGQSWRAKAGGLVAFEILIFVGIYINTINSDIYLTMIRWGRL